MGNVILLTSKDAVEYVMSEFGYTSYYSISKELSKNGSINVQPIQVSSYHKGKRVMGEKTAQLFYEVFGIDVIDVHRSLGRPSEW